MIRLRLSDSVQRAAERGLEDFRWNLTALIKFTEDVEKFNNTVVTFWWLLRQTSFNLVFLCRYSCGFGQFWSRHNYLALIWLTTKVRYRRKAGFKSFHSAVSKRQVLQPDTILEQVTSLRPRNLFKCKSSTPCTSNLNTSLGKLIVLPSAKH